MTSSSCRSLAIRVTGVIAALATTFLASSARAETVSPHLGGPDAASAAAHSHGLAVLDPHMATGGHMAAPVSPATLKVLSEVGGTGAVSGPQRAVFSESILVQPEFPATFSLVRQSRLTHLSGVVRKPVAR